MGTRSASFSSMFGPREAVFTSAFARFIDGVVVVVVVAVVVFCFVLVLLA